MNESSQAGYHLLNAVERMVAPSREISDVVESYRRTTSPGTANLSERIISHYSNRTALAGGVSSLPGLVPGVGTIAVVLGSTLAEMAVVLKLEVEMCLALAHAHGFDIDDRRERQLALLLAAVHTHEVESGRNVLLDMGEVTLTAVSNYTPRELQKLLLRVSSAIAINYATKYVTKGVLKAIPLVGIGIGAGFNKVLTTKVGRKAREWFAWRRACARQAQHGSQGSR